MITVQLYMSIQLWCLLHVWWLSLLAREGFCTGFDEIFSPCFCHGTKTWGQPPNRSKGFDLLGGCPLFESKAQTGGVWFSTANTFGGFSFSLLKLFRFDILRILDIFSALWWISFCVHIAGIYSTSLLWRLSCVSLARLGRLVILPWIVAVTCFDGHCTHTYK